MTEPDRTDRWGWLYAASVVALAAALPFLEFVVQNQGEYFPLGRVLAVAGVTLVLGLGGTLIAVRVTHGDPRRIACVSAWVLAAFFHFNVIFSGDVGVVWAGESIAPIVALLAWIVLTGIGIRFVWGLSDIDGVRQFILLFFAGLCAIQVVVLVSTDTSSADGADATASEEPTTPGERFVERPNIYHFVLDQYPRADIARDALGFDITGFESALEAQGFWIGDRSFSSYPTTQAAIPSVLSMDYPFTDMSSISVGAAEMTSPILGSAPVMQTLRDNGYQYIYASAGPTYWGTCRGELVDRCLTVPPSGLINSDADAALLNQTPLRFVIEPSFSYALPEDVLDSLEASEGQIEEPFFLFAHLWAPHEPFKYEADCSLRDHHQMYADTVEYGQEIHCLNEELLRVIERIRTQDPTAVIILQGDHGTASTIEWAWTYDDWTPDQLLERFAIFDVRLGPEGCEPPPDGPAFAVNTYRWLFACLRQEEPDYLEPRAFFWNYDFQGELVEIEDLGEAFGESYEAAPESGP